MSRILLLNKPYNVLCQFTDHEGRDTLAGFVREKGLYPAGRLDRDSEGLVVLTDDGRLQHCIAHPAAKLEKTYWVQVEGIVDEDALGKLRRGVELKDGPTRPARAEAMAEPPVWPRHPPVRYRATIPTSWLTLQISEGRNRQVRRMTAAVGLPTLRLIRWAIGPWSLAALEPGQWRELTANELATFSARCNNTRRRPIPGQNKRAHQTRQGKQSAKHRNDTS